MILADENLGQIGGPTGFGAFGDLGRMGNPYTAATGIVNGISSIIGFMTIVAAVWFLCMDDAVACFLKVFWFTACGNPLVACKQELK